MKHKGNFSIKLAISAILILIFMISIAFFMQESQAATGYAVVANEKSLVRMTAGLVLGRNSDRTVTRDQVATKLTDYILASKTTVTDDTTRDVIIVKYTDSSNEYEIVKGSKYTIKYETNGSGVTGMPANQVKGHGQSITLTAASPTRDGYRFKGWSTVSTDTTGSYQPGDTYSANASITLYAIWQKKYTISYDANGGSGAPSAQTKWHDEALTLSSTKPTWSNHKFLGWAESSTATTAAYQPGASFTGNKNVTLYAVWHEMYTISYNLNGGTGTSTSQTKEEDVAITLHAAPTRTGYVFGGWKSSATSSTYTGGSSFTENNTTTLTAQWTANTLTVKYYSNYATASFSGATNTVSGTTNVLVRKSTFEYGTKYESGLHNYSTSGAGTYLGRTGYTATGEWGTTTAGGTKVDEDTSFDTGQALAQALGQDISSESQSINLYAQWTENTLTVNYYSNKADGAISSALNTVSATTNVKVYQSTFKYDDAYSSGLTNYTNTSSTYLWLTRTGYNGTGNWGTTAAGGTLVSQDTSFDTGQALAQALGKDLSSASQSINVYAQWTAKTVKVTFYRNQTSSDTTTATQTFTYGVSGQSFSAKGWTYTGHKMLGWAYSRTANAKDEATLAGVTDWWINNYSPSVNLYAVWEQTNYIIFNAGNSCNYTGGFTGKHVAGSSGTLTTTGSKLVMTQTNWQVTTALKIYTTQKVNTTGFTKLKFTYSTTRAGNGAFTIGISSVNTGWDVFNTDSTWVKYERFWSTRSSYTSSIDITGLNSSYYVMAAVFGSTDNNSMTITKIWLE